MRARFTAVVIRLLALLAVLAFGGRQSAGAVELATEFLPSDLKYLDADTEMIGGAYPALLIIPRHPPRLQDEKYAKQFYTAECYGYIADLGKDQKTVLSYKRRFIARAPDREGLDFSKQTVRLLILLYGMRWERMRADHPPNLTTVYVWLTQRVEQGLSPDVGGEQFKNNIYLFDLYRERKPIEWVREIAHEYGHFALTGVSGFTAPEEWANGVLGERLFLKWLRDDLRAGRIQANELPLATLESLNDYAARKITPLIRRVAREGVTAPLMARQDADSMEYYVGFALYLDAVYGSRSLYYAMADTQAASSATLPRAPDFLRGALKSLRSETQFTLTLPESVPGSKDEILSLYLPAGKYAVVMEGALRAWRLPADAKAAPSRGTNRLIQPQSDWRKLIVTREPGGDTPARLILHKESK